MSKTSHRLTAAELERMELNRTRALQRKADRQKRMEELGRTHLRHRPDTDGKKFTGKIKKKYIYFSSFTHTRALSSPSPLPRLPMWSPCKSI